MDPAAPHSFRHLAGDALPLALAGLHRELTPDVAAAIELPAPIPGRVPTATARDAEHLVVGAGFRDLTVEVVPPSRHDEARRVLVRATRADTLPDTVGPDMRLLVCGLNPSRYAAAAGVGYARPGNRFWPAALAAGLVSRDRDASHALAHHGVGLTDLAKRATDRADQLEPGELAAGMARLEWLAGWLAPRAVCFVGLAGWREAVDRRARAGVQSRTVGGRPAYVMPSTSGLNAHASLTALTDHLRAAAVLADRAG
ncbi:MAG: mismatch-specific DNA-glycosylase [Acidimicrobiales bacterium]|nr:mismatch-specific DNA-glycosylase [Actinomycetes bacterium]MCU0267470.1 mismatch-specific DNA-glycosylase [Acidimicrobiales bacterium]